jgi:DnaK suppressor protein
MRASRRARRELVSGAIAALQPLDRVPAMPARLHLALTPLASSDDTKTSVERYWMSDSILSSSQIDELRAHMLRELDALDTEIRALEGMTGPVSPDPAIGRLSRLEAMNEKGVNEAALRSARVRAARIRAALPRLHEQDFGVCVRCDQTIPFARLKSMPGTRLCVRCTEHGER